MTAAWALVTDLDLDAANAHLAALEAAGLLGIVEEHGRATAYFPERRDDLPIPGRWEPVPDEDWNARWKEGIEPVTVGAVTVAPPWIDVPGALVIEPAQAFGTGHHETTTACLAALQEISLAGRAVLDVGTGTGVLALAAKRLGAATVIATDIEPVAVETARDNASRNGLEIDVRLGSADTDAGPYDVVLANLDTPTLTALAGDLAAALAPGGRLVASGISLERVAEACQALVSAGLDTEVRPGREWALVLAELRSQHR